MNPKIDGMPRRLSDASNMNRCAAVVRRWLPVVAAFALAAAGAQAQSTFGPQAVGTTSAEQGVTVTAQAAGTVAKIEVLTQGAAVLDFAAGTSASTCTTGTPLTVGGTCTESVAFTAAAPGLRTGAVVLLDGSGNVLGETLISGTGMGGLGVLVPGNLLPIAGKDTQFTTVGDGNLATNAELNLPAGVVLDGNGNVYIADSLHNRIRMVCGASATPTIKGTSCKGASYISTIAGNGNTSYTGDGGPAVSATVNSPSDVTMDGAGNLYIADTGNNVIREVSAATGIISTVAGDGAGCPAQTDPVGDGCPAYAASHVAASLNSPWGVTLDASGDLYIADTYNHRIRKVDAATGIMTTVAGTGFTNLDGTGGYSGDGGPATSAKLNKPYAVAFDAAGDMYIPDSANNCIRMVNTAGMISTFAGNGTQGSPVDGSLANQAALYAPSGVAVDPAGNVYIADTQNAAIRKVSAATGKISTVIKNGVGEYYYKGQFVRRSLYGPIGLTMDMSGNLYIADYYLMVVRELQSNYTVLDLTATAVRQKDKSTPQLQIVENAGNSPLDLTALTPDANAAVDPATTTCNTGNPLLPVATDCVVGAVFAPSVAGNPLTGNINVGKTGDTPSAPLDIALVGKATAVNSTTITVDSTPQTSNFGQNVTFTATVTTGATSGNLTGTVTFYDGTTVLKSGVPLSAAATTATATFSTSTLTVGLHQITASYDGDTAHFASNSTDPNNTTPAYVQTVQELTATSLASSANPSSPGQNVTFTATVSISGGGGVTPDGNVTFTDGATILGTVALDPTGTATYPTAFTTVGVHPITAMYNGDTAKQIVGSTSSVVNQDVQGASNVTVVSSSPTSNYGVSVTFTATVASVGTTPATGTVNFLDNGTQIGTGTLAGSPGTATFAISTLPVGAHSITVAYLGDTNYAPSNSAPITQTVNQTQTSTTLGATPNPGIAGTPVAITATVQVIAGVATTKGTVTFTDNGTALGSAPLTAAGTATINQTLAPGQHLIVASYGGDSNDQGSQSTAYSLPVVLATTTTGLASSGTPALVLAPITFTAKVIGNGGTPQGTVTFSADGAAMGAPVALDATGTAALTVSNLAAGTHQITANYAGDTNDSPSVSVAFSQVVNKIDTSTDLGVSTTGGTSPQTILVATVLSSTGPKATGTVTFTNGTTTIGSATLDASGIVTLNPNLPPGNYNIVASYGGDDSHNPSASQPVSVSGTATGFSLTVTPPNVSLKTKQNATVTVGLTSSAGFTDTIGLGCASLPAGVTCHFSNFSVPLAANGTVTAQLTIDTNNPLSGGAAAMNQPPGKPGTSLAGLFLPLSAFFGLVFWWLRRRHAALFTTVLIAVVSVATLLATGCSGYSTSSAAPGKYVIQVTGTGANSNVIHYQNVTLEITN